MAVLVRWQQGDGPPATVRCTEVRLHPLMPSHLQLLGVRGANDPEHPDLQVLTLAVRADHVVYLCDCAPAAAATAPAAPQPPEQPAGMPAPPEQPTAPTAPAQAPPRARRARPRPE